MDLKIFCVPIFYVFTVAVAWTVCDEVQCTSMDNGTSCTYNVSQQCDGKVDCVDIEFDEANCSSISESIKDDHSEK